MAIGFSLFFSGSRLSEVVDIIVVDCRINDPVHNCMVIKEVSDNADHQVWLLSERNVILKWKLGLGNPDFGIINWRRLKSFKKREIFAGKGEVRGRHAGEMDRVG